jgi:hypothetical protein
MFVCLFVFEIGSTQAAHETGGVAASPSKNTKPAISKLGFSNKTRNS